MEEPQREMKGVFQGPTHCCFYGQQNGKWQVVTHNAMFGFHTRDTKCGLLSDFCEDEEQAAKLFAETVTFLLGVKK